MTEQSLIGQSHSPPPGRTETPRAVIVLRNILDDLFVDWRTMPDDQMTDAEAEARALVLGYEVSLVKR